MHVDLTITLAPPSCLRKLQFLSQTQNSFVNFNTRKQKFNLTGKFN